MPDFQLNEDSAETIRDQAILQFGYECYLSKLAHLLRTEFDSGFNEVEICSALKGEKSYYSLLKMLCQFSDINPASAIIAPSYSHPADLVNFAVPEIPETSSALASADITSRVSLLQKNSHNIDQLVDKLCERIKFLFESEERHASAIGFNHIDWIQNKFIDLDMVEVDELPSQYPTILDEDDIQNGHGTQNSEEDEYDRIKTQQLLHGRKTTSRKLLQDSKRVFIYGDPGAGKSSYLKWVALHCRNRTFFKDYVPLFLEVRNFPVLGSGQTLMTYFEESFERFGISQTELATVINAGRAYFILDGIDEINKEDYRRLEKMIRRMLIHYDNCRFLISSRLGFDFPFSGLKKVIISPFRSKNHIPKFVENWFGSTDDGKRQAITMLDKFKFPKYRNIREIARRPVLLRLLCVLFEKNNDFPTKRADVFEQGISALVQQSSQHYLGTDIPEVPELKPNDVNHILCRVAFQFFVDMNGNTLFHTREVENVIRTYYSEVHRITSAKINAGHILGMIERYNGLLVRWASTFCSFSHLTYQEYFVAQHLVYEGTQEVAYNYIKNPRWQFIIELVAELLPQDKVTKFLEGFKMTIDSYVNRDEKVRDFLEEINLSASVASHGSESSNPFMRVLMRAWHLVYAIGEDTNKIDGVFLKPDMHTLPDIFYATSMVSNDILELNGALYDTYHCTKQEDPYRLKAQIEKLIRLFRTKDSRKVDTLESWKVQIEHQLTAYDGDRGKWWADKKVRSKWRFRISHLMESLNIPCVIRLSEEQVNQLKKYYIATHLFSTCINRSTIESAKKQEFANSMLLVEHDPPNNRGLNDDFFNI